MASKKLVQQTQRNAIVIIVWSLSDLDTHLIINEEGNIVEEYRKLHLFDVDLSHRIQGGSHISESKYIEPGDRIPDPIYSPIGYIGMSIVFFVFFILQSNDLRYPELYRKYVTRGA